MNAIGDKVKAIRKKHKLNKIDFAETIGISQGRLSEIEQGKTNGVAEICYDRVIKENDYMMRSRR
jgi:transcriptional regulator with XRE-family HTH domain